MNKTISFFALPPNQDLITDDSIIFDTNNITNLETFACAATNNNSWNDTFNNLCSSVEPNNEWPLHVQIIIALICGLLCIMTITGNSLVLLSFITERRLRCYCNFYIINLAICDLLIGLFTMPLFSVYWVLGYWPFGPTMCTCFVYYKYVFTHASFLTLLVISIDRYRALAYPLTHLQERRVSHAVKMIAPTYITPIVIWTVPVWVYPFTDPSLKDELDDKKQCYLLFTGVYSTLVTSVCISWIPLSITAILYYKIYKIIRRHNKLKIQTLRLPSKLGRTSTIFCNVNAFTTSSDTDSKAGESTDSDNCNMKSEKCKSHTTTTGKCKSQNTITTHYNACKSNKTGRNGRNNKGKISKNTAANNISKAGELFVIAKSLSRNRETENTIVNIDKAASSNELQSKKSESSILGETLMVPNLYPIKREGARATKTLTFTYASMMITGMPWTVVALVISVCFECIQYEVVQVRFLTDFS